ncbi:MAG: U32 family peptidase [Clostridia bacterium]|nr:U32 family peptidase [Clostridia bacterium]
MAAEILAPAGSFEALTAAVRCGANAVYLGGKTLNARRNATNFSDEELKKAVEYCHARNVKVYLTLNTLVGDSEKETAYEAIECACNASVDALILQDIGLASMVRQVSPDMPLHASTQMSVQSIEGIRILEKLGFSRAVLPRELLEKEIRKISSQTDMELECFVHGALCMCVSGQCLMSAVLGGRSGNRGLCAQPCRLPFGVNGKGGNNLSLKDLSLVDELSRLENAGVCSFKIEGRMKRPEYVAAAVTACKNSINNTPDNEINRLLHAVFSRSGFTKGYFEGRLGKEMFGTRRKEDVENAAPVLSGLQRLYDKENPLISVDFSLVFKSDEPIKLTASALGKSVTVTGEKIPEKALNKPLSREDLSDRLSKCGGTQFYLNNINTDFEEGLIVSAGALNALRRDALSALSDKLSEKKIYSLNEYNRSFSHHMPMDFTLHARFFREEQIPSDLSGISRIIVPIEVNPETVKSLISQGIEVAAEIPAAVFGNSEKYIEKLTVFKENGLSLAWTCTLDGVGIAEKAGLGFCSGFGMNIYNSISLSELESLGAKDALVSCEAQMSDISRFGGDIPRGLMIYGRIPLMMTRNCPIKNKLTCADCNMQSFLVDRMGVEFPVICKNGASFILNSRPLWIADKKNEIKNIDFGLIYFTNETGSECKKIISEMKNSSNPPSEFTRGMYFKGVL